MLKRGNFKVNQLIVNYSFDFHWAKHFLLSKISTIEVRTVHDVNISQKSYKELNYRVRSL